MAFETSVYLPDLDMRRQANFQIQGANLGSGPKRVGDAAPDR